VQLAATRAYKSWKGEKVESPAKGGLTVNSIIFSRCRRKETVRRKNVLNPGRTGRRSRVSLLL